MVEEILPYIYRIEVPLPGNPLRSVNSYLVRGDKRYLLVDTGMNRRECLDVLARELRRLGVDPEKLDFFITHLHADHVGLVGVLCGNDSKIYFSRKEAPIVNATEEDKRKRWQKLFDLFRVHGFPEEELKQALAEHPGRLYSGASQVGFSLVDDGDTIEIGNYTFYCIGTPGHSPAHLCLYEPEKRILFSGDHILFDITPNITVWNELKNPLNSYLESLLKLSSLEVNLVLPGHRTPAQDLLGRIKELQAHHENRLSEILSALEKGPACVFTIAQYVSWDIRCDSWADFPPPQKWFAFGETLAHLVYLEAEGMVRCSASHSGAKEGFYWELIG